MAIIKLVSILTRLCSNERVAAKSSRKQKFSLQAPVDDGGRKQFPSFKVSMSLSLSTALVLTATAARQKRSTVDKSAQGAASAATGSCSKLQESENKSESKRKSAREPLAA